MKCFKLACLIVLLSAAAGAQSGPKTVFGIPPEKFPEVYRALQQAHLSGGEIAAIVERIEDLMALRDSLVIAAAMAANPDLREELKAYGEGQAELRVKARAALERKRTESAERASPISQP